MRRILSALSLFSIVSVLCSTSIALAQATASEPPPPGFADLIMRMLPMFIMVGFIFYFLVLKPQSEKLKKQQALVTSLKRGEQVVTSGGIVGRVASIEEGYILLEVSPNIKLKVEVLHVNKKLDKPSQEKTAA